MKKTKTYQEHKLFLSKLRQDVRGYYPLIAEATGLSTVAVMRVLKGDWVNADVISSAKKVQKFLKEHGN